MLSSLIQLANDRPQTKLGYDKMDVDDIEEMKKMDTEAMEGKKRKCWMIKKNQKKMFSIEKVRN